jgi:F0F1-type ATP synthase assembly protein I
MWRNVASLTSLGWMIVLPIAAGVLAGRLVDGVLGTDPFGTVLLLTAGICLALIEAYRTMARALSSIRHE